MPVMEITNIKLSPVQMEARKKLNIRSGDTVRVWSKIEDKGKFRLQAFEGVVLARKHGDEIGGTFTVRKVSNGVGVERIFPLYSPMIDKIEVLKHSKTRRSKLYFIREKAVKEIRKRMKSFFADHSSVEEEMVEEQKVAEEVETKVETEASNEEAPKEETVETTNETENTEEAKEESSEEVK